MDIRSEHRFDSIQALDSLRFIFAGDGTGHSDQMWTSSERFYPNVDNFGTFLPKCGQDGSGYSKPLPLLFPVVVGNIAGDAPPPLILRLFLSFRLHEFEREIGGGSRARAGLRPKKKGRLVTHRRFPSQTHAAASSETAAVSKVAARLRRCSHPLPEKEEVAVSNIQSRLVHIWVKTFRTCSHLGKNVPNLSTFGPSHLLKPSKVKLGLMQLAERSISVPPKPGWSPNLSSNLLQGETTPVIGHPVKGCNGVTGFEPVCGPREKSPVCVQSQDRNPDLRPHKDYNPVPTSPQVEKPIKCVKKAKSKHDQDEVKQRKQVKSSAIDPVKA
ncbi:hypothetical protein LXL04_004778 [Taraxacum kok-saghyz]